MSNGHTPGDWHVSELDATGEKSKYYIFIEPGVAVIERSVTGEHDMNDARLIAAAPDLLEALELLNQSAPAASCEMFHHDKQDRHTFLEECPPLIRYEQACLKARAALAKARGTPC